MSQTNIYTKETRSIFWPTSSDNSRILIEMVIKSKQKFQYQDTFKMIGKCLIVSRKVNRIVATLILTGPKK